MHFSAAVLWAALLTLPTLAEAHSGGADRAGCHRSSQEGMRRHCHRPASGTSSKRDTTQALIKASIVGSASIIDGDTLEIHGVRIRLHGIDAPESGQTCTDPKGRAWRCGQQAALKISEKIGRSSVTCEGRTRDRYNRLVSVCYVGGQDINRWMVIEGWAASYRRYSSDYAHEEAVAISLRRNIWSGTFDLPWNWRAARKRR